MSRVRDAREDVHQPLWDTYLRGIGVSAASTQFQLFGNSNVGRKELTNLPSAGFLASDQVYVTKALRCVLNFQGLNDDQFNLAFGAIVAVANILGVNSRAEDLYGLCAYGGLFTFTVGNKPMIQAPLWYVPAGGGPSGFTTENSRHVITNGVASQEAIMKLGLPVIIDARQNFNVQLDFFPFQRFQGGLGAGGGAIGTDIDVLQYINQFDGLKLIQFHLDGYITRDIQ